MPGDDTYLPELNLSEIEALKDGLKYFKVSQLRELSRSLGVRQGKKKAETIENIRAIIDRFLKPFDKVSLVTIIVLTEMLKARPDLPVFASLYRGLETGTVNYQSTLQSISALKSSSVPNYRTHPTNIKAVSKKAPPTRSPFTLVFEPSPFHELIKDLPEFPGVGYGSATRSQILMNITLSPEDRELLKDPSNRVYLRCTNFDKVSVRTCSIEYPDKMELSVNGQTIKESGVRGIKNVPGTARPFDITDHLKQESNSIKLLFIDKNPFMLIGSICKKFSITEVLQKLNMKRIPKEVEIQKIKASHDNTDDDISVGIEKVSLKCPLSYARIRLPVKSEQCDHTGCFDAYSFLALQEQISTWKCPICQKRISAEELRISEYFEDIIKSSKIETEMVMLAEDGGWIEQMQDDDDISETDSSKHMVREPAKDESMIETIVLDSDESDEESAEDPPETALSDDLDDIPIAAAAFRHVPRVISDDDGEGNIEQPTESPHPDKVRGSALSGDSLGDTLLDAPGRSEQPVEMLSDTPAPAAESETTPQNQFQPTQSPSDMSVPSAPNTQVVPPVHQVSATTQNKLANTAVHDISKEVNTGQVNDLAPLPPPPFPPPVRSNSGEGSHLASHIVSGSEAPTPTPASVKDSRPGPAPNHVHVPASTAASDPERNGTIHDEGVESEPNSSRPQQHRSKPKTRLPSTKAEAIVPPTNQLQFNTEGSTPMLQSYQAQYNRQASASTSPPNQFQYTRHNIMSSIPSNQTQYDGQGNLYIPPPNQGRMDWFTDHSGGPSYIPPPIGHFDRPSLPAQGLYSSAQRVPGTQVITKILPRPQNEDLTSEAPIGRDTGKEVSNTVVDPPTNDEYRSDYSHMSHYPHASLVPRATSLFGPSSVLLSGPNNQSHRTREEQMTCGSTQIPNRAEPMSSGQIVSLPSLNLMVGEGQDKLSTSLPLRPIQLPSDSVAQVHSNNVRSGIRNGTSFQNFSSRSSSITSPSSGETEAQANTQKKESSTPNHMVRSHRSYNLISNILSEQDRPSTSSTEGQKDLVIAQSTGGNGRTTGNSSAQNLSKNTEIPPTTHQDVPENTGLSSGASQVQLLKEKIRSYKQNQIGDIDGAPEDVFPEPSRNTSGKGAQHVNQPADSAQSSTSPKGLNEIVSTDPNRNGPSKGSKTVVENRDDFVWVDGESNEPPRMAPVAPSQKTLPHTSINNQVIENPTSERNAESSNYSTSKPVQANFSNINPVQKHQNDSDNEEAITPMKKKTKTMGLLGIHLSDDPRDYSISPLNGKVGEMNLNSP
ncbi:hypothetical protein CANTEDRAFT_91613 [Yamadazyma tenuis ATCC 10573]|uniref:SP-RING-type domain-containing protein n=1 Tax=Candida tenuis (strain ATCC 10573 / BCRC 21748 / CBS 615 / JCM 9827 / NBRC 10315 / NRRL Y-1498 / VKM Y-70) TaxID=590646 RepID=G3AW43_CANTC|nr:uncharacterized protein CANTEDRAFT_91613 [Yamadazyma tenuis ATCC 10573]EGV66447.1 hypothetical protein CANTEDRAFT_91613 [Yamadazyma tenuis ATCC 10573]